ncbi:YbhB/YbcL family Raf kinase inhibitor-like protein [Nocardia altamirensis]|uniref:YbhB/YbcL family Raf kinase inhibitor-like protein n=1 Tax=Nocardia altamirensis TaxID=472158 RepID=UPI000A72BA8A|nr:YbhB/YbcL family Raf kinase inhibitor-like protein [Nocardia altamirensis]
MNLWSNSFKDGDYIPGEFAFTVSDPETHTSLSDNRNPHLAWAQPPDATQSMALICHDPDVPSRGDDVNQEGRTVPADLPRVEFFHWVLVDLPPSMQSIAAASFSDGVIPRGKPGPEIQNFPGLRQGLNDYTGLFANDPAMSGDYFGYDGPGPSWNDELVHRYVFTLYALDIPRLPVTGKFTGPQALAAMQDHILNEEKIVGLIYPESDFVVREVSVHCGRYLPTEPVTEDEL